MVVYKEEIFEVAFRLPCLLVPVLIRSKIPFKKYIIDLLLVLCILWRFSVQICLFLRRPKVKKNLYYRSYYLILISYLSYCMTEYDKSQNVEVYQKVIFGVAFRSAFC